ncbi:unnamed protein product [Mytilus coruscus]|uniref:Novel STAND NTPase 3 domain-containing protein n=1 Tax=Mytilus coruscus TaxID=42192 RepID=A0A6J8EV34_MYTCO|nr:unnamed protein product [Mytilus coruscus]
MQIGELNIFLQKQHRLEIDEWEQDQTTFVETRATRQILESVSCNNIIVVTGSSGCGKSANIHHAVLNLRDRFQYEIIPVSIGPEDILKYYKTQKNQAFVVDDICGKETINLQTLQMWTDYSEKMMNIFKISENGNENKTDSNVSKVSGPKLIVSCRLHIYKESQLQLLTLLSRKEINLLSEKFCLLRSERMRIAQMYIPAEITYKLNDIRGMMTVDFFPLLCKLSKDKSYEEVINLFTAPVDNIAKNIKHIVLNKKDQFYALVLCILFPNGVNIEWLNLKSVSKEEDKLEDILKEFDINLSKEMSRNSLKLGFAILDGTYLRRRGTMYRMIHDKIYEMAAVICGQHLTECFMIYAPTVCIRDLFIFESTTEVHANDDVIIISEEKENDYFLRLLCDLKKCDITSTFNNKQLIYQSFNDKLISFFRRNDEANTLLKELNSKVCEDDACLTFPSFAYTTTPLIESASNGNFDIVHFLIENVKCNVNKPDQRGRSALFMATERRHADVVNLLLQNDADVSQCNDIGESPLHVACKRDHKDIVEILLRNNANVSQCNIWGNTALRNGKCPLYLACEEGHINIVKLLLQNNACVSQYDNNGEFPLYAACAEGHIDIVKLLLQNNANVSQYTFRGNPSLCVACKHGHINIVKLLLQNNANVSQCGRNGKCPLYVACEEGHTNIVKLLLQNNAYVSQCEINGKFPLYVASEEGHIDIVKLLLQNNANVSQCDRHGKFPFYMACEEGHTDIAKLLLQKNDDVSKCDNSGKSPLLVACEQGNTDIVELLLQNNADISQKYDIGNISVDGFLLLWTYIYCTTFTAEKC